MINYEKVKKFETFDSDEILKELELLSKSSGRWKLLINNFLLQSNKILKITPNSEEDLIKNKQSVYSYIFKNELKEKIKVLNYKGDTYVYKL